jgi:deoxyribonuclease V
LERIQSELGSAGSPTGRPGTVLGRGSIRSIGACYVCFGRGGHGVGSAGDRGWAGAALTVDGKVTTVVTVSSEAGAAYDPGHLALREGPLLEAALLALPMPPEALLVNATGRDHPRRAGVAVHLGARLGRPSVGVTNRLLIATGEWPADERLARTPLQIGDEIVGFWVRTRRGTRPLAVHAGWHVDAENAVEIVLSCTRGARTPEPLRAARRAAREAREREQGGRLR